MDAKKSLLEILETETRRSYAIGWNHALLAVENLLNEGKNVSLEALARLRASVDND